MMTSSKYVLASVRHHWRVYLSVVLAVAAATTVLTGALVVGDSVRGSLRHLALDRIGTIGEVVLADRFFQAKLADELKADPRFQRAFGDALPAILIEGTLETTGSHAKSRANNVTVFGIGELFWSLGKGLQVRPMDKDQVVLNEPLAAQLGVKTGDEILLRVGQASQIPADSPLGHKSDLTRTRRLIVSQVIPARSLGRFGLRPNQQLPLNAFVPVGTLQEMLEQTGKVNVVFATAPTGEDVAIDKVLAPTLADFGLRIEQPASGVVSLTSTRMLLDPAVEANVRKALPNHTIETAFTYLANYIKVADGRGKIPYSTITAIDRVPTLGELMDGEIVLNRWAADDLAKQGVIVKPGDDVTIEYFEPESTHGEVREQSATFRLKAIAEMTPAVADRSFTPELPGVTDQRSIANWDPPFPYDDARVRSRKPHDEDEAYWDNYKATPKAFISLAAGRKLWSSRFGNATSLRITPAPGESVDQIARKVRAALPPAEMGFQVLPVRRWALQASAGTTPFNLLFLGFSMFLIAAAMMLIAVLFRLGLEQRAEEIGVLAAVGIERHKIVRMFIGEALLVCAVAGILGVAGGIGYAWLMLVGLQTWWLEAIRTPFLRLYVLPGTLLIGYFAGLCAAGATIFWTLRRMRSISVRRLLAGEASEQPRASSPAGVRWRSALAFLLLAFALGLAIAGGRALGGANQLLASGMFFGSGVAALAAMLYLIGARLRAAGMGHGRSAQNLSRPRPTSSLQPLALAFRNASRNPQRSLLTMGLIASATFLIIAISAFRLDPTRESAGGGGFELICQTSQPIYRDLNGADSRAELGFSNQDEAALAGINIFSLRLQPGSDSSCLNLYQTTQPRAIGVPASFIERGQFAWAGTLAITDAERRNPWLLLDRPASAEVPIVLDANTAMYSLHQGLGDVLQLTDGRGKPFPARIVGLLQNSIFQGDMLMSENHLLSRFPDVNGYRLFLVESPDANIRAVQSVLETALGDYGFDAEQTTARLADFFAVQNTYLSTFQTLGGLGLILGTFGLAAVQMRNVIERRGEMALLRAVGFSRRKLVRLVLLENAVLLTGGLSVGIGAALVAVLPHWISGDASTPWASLAVTLVLILAIGLLAGWLTSRVALRMPILAALRGD
jgi:ABC-type lipoprotein release transport system permease subunit